MIRSALVWSVADSRSKKRLALRQEIEEVVAELVDPVLRLRAHRVERVEVAQLPGRLHLADDVARLEVVDLVHGDDHRLAEREDPPRDEAVAGADPVACRDDEEHDVDVLERAVDGVLHPLGQLVHRALEPGQVDEDELVVLGVRDAVDPAAGRIGDRGGDRDLLADQRVHERRLADVRAAGDGDEARLHASGRSQVSGSSSSAL